VKAALIVFVKNLVPGRVKTRLAATLGHDEALKAYRYLLKHTQQIAEAVQADKYIFYSNALEDQGWPQTYGHMVQQGVDLGGRMAWAFEKVFEQGHKKVVIIGSDCLELQAPVITQAFDELERYDVVIGPANDGGYYLLGLTQTRPELFHGMAWSTPAVLSQSIQVCRQAALTVSLLPWLTDIDEAEDWLQAKKAIV
jgi:rSAM/selenodomain-associated transferase 1